MAKHRVLLYSGIFQNAPQRNIREPSTNPHLSRKSLVIRLMTSRSHAWAGWLSSRRSQIMAASIGLGERDSRWKTRGWDLVMVFATFSGSTDTRSDVARICTADKNGARIAGLEVGLDLPGPASTKSGPN